MKQLFVNLKRFDIPEAMGGVNRLAPVEQWAAAVVAPCEAGLKPYPASDVQCTFFFPEAHLLAANAARAPGGPLRIGCQGVCGDDVAPGGNFGALTTGRPAAAAKALGCQAVLLGHCEERRDKLAVVGAAGSQEADAVDRLLNRELLAAAKRDLDVLYCIGETEAQRENWQAVLARQLELGLAGADAARARVTIAYEPVWAIGPGKQPPGRESIQTAARFIKAQTGGLPLVYGGGLKAENAAMLASIPEIDGGLIALTRFSGEIGFYPAEFLNIVRLYLAPLPQ